MPAPSRPTNPIAKLLEAAKADPKKAGVLAVLITVLGTMWVRMATQDGGGPQSANAATSAGAASDRETAARARAAGRGELSTAASAALVEWRAAPVSPIVRNLFTVEFDHYAHQRGVATAPVERVEEGFWDELAKSLSSQADQSKQRQIRTANAVRDAGQMNLQTIVMGASPKAVIDGEMVGEGSVVAGFRVSRIEARRIIIEREGIRLEIPMK